MNIPARRGFTLVELLVGLALATGLVAGMTVAAAGVMDVWHRAGGGLVADAQATAALDQLELDLQAMVVAPPGRGVWLAVAVEDDVAALVRRGWSPAGSLKPAQRSGADVPPSDAARFGRGGASLRFFTTPVSSDGGLPSAVAYQLVRWSGRPGPAGGPGAGARYVLCRTVVEPGRTLEAGFDLQASAYRTGAAGAGRPASLARPRAAADALAANVLDFGVWVAGIDRRGGEVRLFPVTAADPGLALAEVPPAGQVLVVDIMVRVATEEGARRLAALEAGGVGMARGAEFDDRWWRTAETHSRVHWRRVLVRAEGA